MKRCMSSVVTVAVNDVQAGNKGLYKAVHQ